MRASLWLLVWTLVAAAGWRQQQQQRQPTRRRHSPTTMLAAAPQFVNSICGIDRETWDGLLGPRETVTPSLSHSRSVAGMRLYGMSKQKMHRVKLDYEAKKNGNWFAKLRLVVHNLERKLRQMLISWLLWVQEQRAQFLASHLRYAVYVLECAGGKYYVGSTQRPIKERWREHASLRGGSMWTKMHKPLRILHREGMSRIPPLFYLGVESRITAKLMMIHGLNNVRGAQFSDPRNLTTADLPALTGFIGHNLGMDYKEVERLLLLRLPPAPTETNPATAVTIQLPSLKSARSSAARRSQFTQEADLYSFLEEAVVREEFAEEERGMYCVRCGRSNHAVVSCFATTTIKGRAILGQKPSAAKGGRQDKEKEGVCHRCGRPGHYRKNCAEQFDAVGALIVDSH